MLVSVPHGSLDLFRRPFAGLPVAGLLRAVSFVFHKSVRVILWQLFVFFSRRIRRYARLSMRGPAAAALTARVHSVLALTRLRFRQCANSLHHAPALAAVCTCQCAPAVERSSKTAMKYFSPM